jgi:Tol biopolymer transport system component
MLIWSTDGRAIFFGQGTLREMKLMRIQANGGTPEFTGLTLKEVSVNDSIDLSPDGSRLVFSAGRATVSP